MGAAPEVAESLCSVERPNIKRGAPLEDDAPKRVRFAALPSSAPVCSPEVMCEAVDDDDGLPPLIPTPQLHKLTSEERNELDKANEPRLRAEGEPGEQGNPRNVIIMASIHDYSLDTSDALFKPSCAQLKNRIEHLGLGLWKIGGCYMDLLDVRPRNAAHYNPKYFDRDGAVCLAYGMTDKQNAAMLETTAIQHAKFQLRIGVNTKSQDDVPHDGYSPERPAALYAVPVRPHITTQQQFEKVHVSYYMERTHGTTTKEERKAAKEERKAAKRAPGGVIGTKRAKLLKAYIDMIPMQQLRRAFSGRNALSDLVTSYGFKTLSTTIFNELKELFAEY